MNANDFYKSGQTVGTGGYYYNALVPPVRKRNKELEQKFILFVVGSILGIAVIVLMALREMPGL